MTRGWVSPPLLNFARKIYLSGPQQVLGADPALDPKKFADPWPILFTHASTNYRTPCMDIQNSVLLGGAGGTRPRRSSSGYAYAWCCSYMPSLGVIPLRAYLGLERSLSSRNPWRVTAVWCHVSGHLPHQVKSQM